MRSAFVSLIRGDFMNFQRLYVQLSHTALKSCRANNLPIKEIMKRLSFLSLILVLGFASTSWGSDKNPPDEPADQNIDQRVEEIVQRAEAKFEERRAEILSNSGTGSDTQIGNAVSSEGTSCQKGVVNGFAAEKAKIESKRQPAQNYVKFVKEKSSEAQKSSFSSIQEWTKDCERAATAFYTCYDREGDSNDLTGALSSTALNIGNACNGISKAKKSLGGFKKAKLANTAYKDSEAIISTARDACEGSLDSIRSSNMCSAESYDQALSAAKSILDGVQDAKVKAEYEAEYTNWVGHKENLTKLQNEIGIVREQFALATQAAGDFKRSAGKTARGFKTAAIIGGVGAAGITTALIIKGNKKEKRKKEEAAADFEKGVITDAKGKKTDCLTPSTFNKSECKPALFNFCAKEENQNNPGCSAFANHVCSGSEASQSYCTAKSAKAYCSQQGSVIGSSPTCQWLASRPASCATNPENIACLAKVSNETLSAQCGSFPNDPLCLQHQQGTLLTQPQDSQLVQATTTSNSGSLNNLVSGGGRGVASTTLAKTDVFGSNSQALLSLCKSGDLSCGK